MNIDELTDFLKRLRSSTTVNEIVWKKQEPSKLITEFEDVTVELDRYTFVDKDNNIPGILISVNAEEQRYEHGDEEYDQVKGFMEDLELLIWKKSL